MKKRRRMFDAVDERIEERDRLTRINTGVATTYAEASDDGVFRLMAKRLEEHKSTST